MTLGDKLYKLRTQKELSHEKMGFELDISKTAIIKWEQNKSKPSIDNLLKICNYFETDVYTLLEEVSNVNFSNAKFKGSSYVINPNNSTINYTTSPELIKCFIDTQKQITSLIDKQNELFAKIINNQ